MLAIFLSVIPSAMGSVLPDHHPALFGSLSKAISTGFKPHSSMSSTHKFGVRRSPINLRPRFGGKSVETNSDVVSGGDESGVSDLGVKLIFVSSLELLVFRSE